MVKWSGWFVRSLASGSRGAGYTGSNAMHKKHIGERKWEGGGGRERLRTGVMILKLSE
jgi:hypothetical protein